MTKQVRVLVDKQGVISAKTEGYVGAECKDASKIFEELGTVISDNPTRDMYDRSQIQGVEVVGGI
jgi:hypothetical protein